MATAGDVNQKKDNDVFTLKILRELVERGDYARLAKEAYGQSVGEFVTEDFISNGKLTLASQGLKALEDRGEVYAPELRANQMRCLQYLLRRYPPTESELGGLYDNSLLELAIATGRVEVVKAIFRYDPVFRTENEHRSTACTKLGSAREAVEMASFLFSQPQLKLKGFGNTLDETKALCLQFAIHDEQFDLVRWLVAQGVDVATPVPVHNNFKHKFNQQYWAAVKDAPRDRAFPIHFCVSHRMTALLESFGARLDVADPDVSHGVNALFPALRFGAHSYLQYLLSRGMSVNHVATHGVRPLHCAARSATHKEVSLLLAAGADLNVTDEKGKTPIMWSVGAGQNKAKLASLMGAGADLYGRDSNGDTIFSGISEKAGIEMATERILQDALDGKTLDPGVVAEFACAVVKKKMGKSGLQLMACKAFNFDFPGATQSTPVHEAVKVFKDHFFDVFLNAAISKGFDLESRNERGYTVLMEAVSNKNGYALQLLIDRGADPHSVTPAGTTAFKLARDPAIKRIFLSNVSVEAISGSVVSDLRDQDGKVVAKEHPGRSKPSFGLL